MDRMAYVDADQSVDMKNHEMIYLQDQGLTQYIDFDSQEEDIDVYEVVDGSKGNPLPPQPDDLARIHKLSRNRGAMTILEFGVGYSTIVLADALSKNQTAWQDINNKPDIRNRHKFELHVTDASEKWISYWKEQFPDDLCEYVYFHKSDVKLTTHLGKMCHKYKSLPDVIPDFIYIDAPDPTQVKGTHRGMSFQCAERTVMSADLLDMEPTLLPGTCVLIDGRTNNARFLKRNLQRDFEYEERVQEDVSIFRLNERPLGEYNKQWPIVNSEISLS
jgi:hypothetical protein